MLAICLETSCFSTLEFFMATTEIPNIMNTSQSQVYRKSMDIQTDAHLSKLTGLSLRKNFSWNLIGNIVYSGCQWAMLVVLAKLTNTEVVGRFALGLAITAPIILFSQLQLRGIQATDAKGEYNFGHYLGLRLLTTVIALFLIIGVALANGYPFETALVIIAVGFSKAFESVSDVYYGLMQRYERMDRIARSYLIKGPLSLAVLSIMVYLTSDVFWGVVGFSTVWGVLLLTYDLKNAGATLNEFKATITNNKNTSKQMWPVFNRRKLLRLVWLALPLGIVMTLLSLNTNIPRYFIESHFGESKLGIFAALVYLIVAGKTIVMAMGQAVVPRLSIYYAKGEINPFKKLMFHLLGIGFFLGMGGVLMALIIGRPILILLYRPEYAEHTIVFVWLMVVGGLSYVASILGYAMTAARYFKAQLPLFIIVTLTTYLASLWLIPKYALLGAAFSLLAGTLVQILGSGIIIVIVLKNLKKQLFHA